jgi:hypothetical protein
MSLYEQQIPLEDGRKAKWVRLKVLCASPIVAMMSRSGTKIALRLEGQKTTTIEICLQFDLGGTRLGDLRLRVKKQLQWRYVCSLIRR